MNTSEFKIRLYIGMLIIKWFENWQYHGTTSFWVLEYYVGIYTNSNLTISFIFSLFSDEKYHIKTIYRVKRFVQDVSILKQTARFFFQYTRVVNHNALTDKSLVIHANNLSGFENAFLLVFCFASISCFVRVIKNYLITEHYLDYGIRSICYNILICSVIMHFNIWKRRS